MLILWTVALAVAPINVLGLGMPEPAHFVLLAMMLCLVAAGGWRYDRDVVMAGLPWLAVVAVVNLAWFGHHQDPKFILAVGYYWFNFFVLLLAAHLAANRPGFDTATRWALALALAVQLVVVAVASGMRARGTFENPNALGYWALLAAASWLALKERGDRLTLADAGMLAAVAALCVASGSRAALVGAAVLAAIGLSYGVRLRVLPALAVLVVSGGIVAAATHDRWIGALTEHAAVERLDKSGKHDSFEGRNYDRITDFPWHALLGAGEGAYARFARLSDVGRTLEIHSSPATILFGYGVLGTAAFGLLMWAVFGWADWRRLALIVPLLMYGMAHQGLRATMLWAFFGVVVGLTRMRRARAIMPARSAPAPWRPTWQTK